MPAVDPLGAGHAPPAQFAGSPDSAQQWQATRTSAGLSFAGAVARCLKNSVNFKDRAVRSEYWWFVVFCVVVLVGLVGLEVALLGRKTAVLTGVAWVLLQLPLLAVTVRRLHDTGKSGWLQLISFVPLVGPILLTVWLASPGEPTPNNWGPPPGTAAEVLRETEGLVA